MRPRLKQFSIRRTITPPPSTQSETGYTGISVERIDAFVDVPPDGCNGPYQGHPIYQSEWVGALNGSDWLELGTGHQCSNSYQYHYWGYGYNGVWNPIGSVKIGGGEIHTYRITRGADSIWEFRIDGVIKDSFYWDRTFPSVSTGLESYAPYGNVNPYNHYHLNYQRLGNTTWNGWDGTDSTLLQNPPMCGLWNNPQSWRTGEASSC